MVSSKTATETTFSLEARVLIKRRKAAFVSVLDEQVGFVTFENGSNLISTRYMQQFHFPRNGFSGRH